jgi:cyclase
MPLSRRDFLATSAVAAVFSAIGRPAAARAWQTQTPPPAQPVFTPIRRNVGFFTMRGGTIGYLVDPASVVVVDSQYAVEGKACLDGLNTRSKNRAVDLLINTHHHGDHTGGNISFKGSAKHVVSHVRAAELMKNPPGAQPPPPDQLFPDTTFTDSWAADAGGEKMRAKFYGAAHTSGDVVVTFERANVAHMGDLMFNQRHPLVDRAAGASIKNWIAVLERVPRDHAADTIYIFGHANTGLPVTGSAGDLGRFRDYLGAVWAFVAAQIKAGRTREDILAMRDPLKGFETFGPFPAPNPRDPLTVAYEEQTSGS